MDAQIKEALTRAREVLRGLSFKDVAITSALEAIARTLDTERAPNGQAPAQPAPAAQDDASVQPSTCTWSLDDEDSSTWSSSCGELWSFISGGPDENRVTYCHHCGKPVDVARAADKKEPT